MADVQNGKRFCRYKLLGSIKNGKCHKWQIFLLARASLINKILNNGKCSKWQKPLGVINNQIMANIPNVTLEYDLRDANKIIS